MNQKPSANLEIPSLDRVVEVAFNAEGTLLAVLYIDGSVRFYESDESRKFLYICEIQPCCHRATSISFSPSVNGAIIAFGDDSGKIFIYQRSKVNEFRHVTSIQRHKTAINALAFAPIKDIVIAAAASEGTASITTLVNNAWTVSLIHISESPLTSISWSPPQYMSFIDQPNTSSTCHFVVSSADGNITLVKYGGGAWTSEKPLKVHDSACNCAAWRPLAGFSRTEIATCGVDKVVKLWTQENYVWNSTDICTCEEEPNALKWSSCGFILSVSSGLNTVQMWREFEDKWKQVNTTQ